MSVGKASIQRAAAKNIAEAKTTKAATKTANKTAAGKTTGRAAAKAVPKEVTQSVVTGNTIKISFRQQASRRGKACKDRRGPAGLSALIIIGVNIAFYNINSLRFFENPVA